MEGFDCLIIGGFWDLQTISFEIPWFLGKIFFAQRGSQYDSDDSLHPPFWKFIITSLVRSWSDQKGHQPQQKHNAFHIFLVGGFNPFQK